MGKQKSKTFPGLFQDFFILQGPDFFQILYGTTFKKDFFSARSGKMKGALDFFDSDTGDKNRDYRTNWIE